MEPKEKELSNASDEDFGDLGSESDSSDEDIDNDSSSSDGEDSSPHKRKRKIPNKKPKKTETNRIVFNVSDTQYDVVKYVGKRIFNWKLSYDRDGTDWDVFWTDCAVQPETLARMQTYQKINHFPGMYSLARKNHLGKNLMRMKKCFPENYKFFPQTFLLPTEYSEFQNQFTKKKNKTFIVKPEASCQGRGIFLTRNPDSIKPGEHYVVQRYLHKPFLIDGLKFDMRIYVLLAGTDPLKVFLYDDGLGRFATEPYVPPMGNNLDNVCMHLTNYAINKDSPNFVFNENANADDVGHKRSLKAVMRTLKERGHDVDGLWKDIKKIIIKTFCSVQPILAHSYKSCHPDEPYNNMCFELLGFDVMLDHKLKPWLIEVNHTPSFTTDTPLDKSIKKSAIRDALRIMNVSVENKIVARNKKRAELQQRVLTGKKPKLTPEEKAAAFEKAQKERKEWEAKNCGRYEQIYPIENPEEDYEEFMRTANKWFEEWTGIAQRKIIRKNADNKPPPMVFGTGSSPAVQKTKEVQPSHLVKQKTITLQKPGTAQGPKSQQPTPNNNNLNAVENKPAVINGDRIVKNIEQESENEVAPEPMDFMKDLDDENKDFMAHITAIKEDGPTDVVGEDHNEGGEESEKPVQQNESTVKPLPKTISASSKVEEKAEEKLNETDLDYKAASYSSSTYLNRPASGPEDEPRGEHTRNTSFKIRTVHNKKDSPQKSMPEHSSFDGKSIQFLTKFAHYTSVEKVEDLQIAVGAIPGRISKLGRDADRDSYSKKVPMKLASGVVGHFGAGIHHVWANESTGLSSMDLDRDRRNGNNSLYNKISVRSESNGRYAPKKIASPSYHQYGKPMGNYLPPKVYELNLGLGPREASPKLGAITGGTHGIPVINKGHGRGEQRDSGGNITYFPNSQAAVQKYYNFLTSKK